MAAAIAVLGSVLAADLIVVLAVGRPGILVLTFIAWAPMAVGGVWLARGHADGLAWLGGAAIGMTLDSAWQGRALLAVYAAIALASVGIRERGGLATPWQRTTSLLALGALGVWLTHGALVDLDPSVISAPGTLSARWARTGLELAALTSLASFAAGRTSGLIGLIVWGSAWLIHGAVGPALEARCGCTGCSGHPLALGLAEPAAYLLVIAIAPWLGPMARHLRGRGA